ncbi:MAG TPA: DUF3093 domain-containing protein [Micromonosporaceae bacterium]
MPSRTETFSERLTVPWWAWPAVLAITAGLTAQLTMGAFALRHPLTYTVTAVAVVIGLLALSRIRIAVDDGAGEPELRVDDARLPVRFIASVVVLDATARRDLLGVDADPLAFVIQRPWVAGGVRVELTDPADPTPYWFISTRHPDRLAATLLAARERVGSADPAST